MNISNIKVWKYKSAVSFKFFCQIFLDLHDLLVDSENLLLEVLLRKDATLLDILGKLSNSTLHFVFAHRIFQVSIWCPQLITWIIFLNYSFLFSLLIFGVRVWFQVTHLAYSWLAWVLIMIKFFQHLVFPH
jgi:hypothetical protein